MTMAGPEEETSSSAHSSKTRHAPKDSSTTREQTRTSKEIEETAGFEDEISIAPSSASTVSEHEKKDKVPAEPPATLARTTSVTAEAVIIDRRKRRGPLAHLALIPEVENPFHYARKSKWLITSIVAFCAMAAPMGSAIVMPVLQDIGKAFNASAVTANMSVAVYMLSMAIFPLWWSSFSETGGRRAIYLISFILFTLFSILSAVATNIAMLVVVRTFAGGAAASVQAVGAGTIADIWEPRERGKAMGIFYLGPLCGPLLSPIIGGVLGQELGWRSTQWFLVIYGGVTVILIIFALPETLRRKDQAASQQRAQTNSSEKADGRPELARVSTRQSVQQKTKSYLSTIRRIFLDPLVVLTWMRFPAVGLTVYYASITFGSLYFLNISIQATFSAPPYGFSTLIIGLLYIPGSVGYLIASILGGRWIDKIMQREAKKAGRYDENGKLIFRPEDRMRENAWIGSILWPGALMWYGWTAEYGIHWVVPMIANFIFGLGSMLIFSLATTMLTEFMPQRASSGVAINNFFRNIFSFIGAIVAEPIIHAIGNGWLTTILGLWSIVSGFAVLYSMKRYGPVWREKMGEALG